MLGQIIEIKGAEPQIKILYYSPTILILLLMNIIPFHYFTASCRLWRAKEGIKSCGGGDVAKTFVCFCFFSLEWVGWGSA